MDTITAPPALLLVLMPFGPKPAPAGGGNRSTLTRVYRETHLAPPEICEAGLRTVTPPMRKMTRVIPPTHVSKRAPSSVKSRWPISPRQCPFVSTSLGVAVPTRPVRSPGSHILRVRSGGTQLTRSMSRPRFRAIPYSVERRGEARPISAANQVAISKVRLCEPRNASNEQPDLFNWSRIPGYFSG